MLRQAIVVRTATGADARLAPFLDLLGIEWEALTPVSLLNRYQLEILTGKEIQVSLILCGEALNELRAEVDKNHIPSESIGKAFAGSLVHSFDRSRTGLRAIEGFFEGVRILAPKISTGQLRYEITAKNPEMCGALSGLSFQSLEKAVDCGVDFESRDGFIETVIGIGQASILTYARQESRELFIASSPEILDLRESISKNIDFRTCFSRIVPILIALRHLFRGSCWTPEAHYANIIIDDPPLWQRYGHLELRDLAALVDRTGCACTIAMIPWNYRRSDRRAVSLVASRQPRLSVCIHGCNHTGAEFGCKDRQRLMSTLLTARRRMEAHQGRTGLPHQTVMVFPQGVFSIEAMDCLRSAGYLAAANTEVADCWSQGHLTLQDLLQPTVLCYEGSPLFARRRPDDGIVNFAVDSFLGKPCLVVLHHDFFKGGVRELEELVHAFANFHPRLSWDSLENIVTGCTMSKCEVDGRTSVLIFADRAILKVDQRQGERLTVIKREAGSAKIRRVEVDGRSSDFSVENDFLKLNLEPRTNRPVSINIVSEASPAFQTAEDSLTDKARVAVRRYLCEFRDGYSAKSGILLKRARSLARALQPH
jgi:hypothetical protein